jgi:hypothetical protein
VISRFAARTGIDPPSRLGEVNELPDRERGPA